MFIRWSLFLDHKSLQTSASDVKNVTKYWYLTKKCRFMVNLEITGSQGTAPKSVKYTLRRWFNLEEFILFHHSWKFICLFVCLFVYTLTPCRDTLSMCWYNHDYDYNFDPNIKMYDYLSKVKSNSLFHHIYFTGLNINSINSQI